MPRLIHIPCNCLLALRVADNETILSRMSCQPVGFLCSGKAAFCRAFAIRAGQVDRQTRLMFAVSRHGAIGTGFLFTIFFDIVIKQPGLRSLGTVAGNPGEMYAVF
ncbi:hypothetical protein D3C73_1466530 [compost metagenome]